MASDANKRAEALVNTIVIQLDNSLNLPDEEVIKQDDVEQESEPLSMYFVGSGHCKVKMVL